MYATYCYKAGSTAANVSADIIKLLTGETNLANLSADCVTASSNITSTVSAGWTVHDAAAATNFQVIKALCQDGTTYKYYRFGCPSTSVVEGTISEGWNATTHTATNGHTTGSSAVQSSWNGASGGYFYIFASQKTIAMFSFHTSAYANLRGLHVLEHTRDTLSAGYPCFASSYGTGYSAAAFPHVSGGYAPYASPRAKNADQAGDALSNISTTWGNTALGLNAVTYAQATTSYAALYRDASEVLQAITYKIGAAGLYPNSAARFGPRYYGEVYDLLAASIQLGSARDEITISGKTYVLHGDTGTGWLWLLPKE